MSDLPKRKVRKGLNKKELYSKIIYKKKMKKKGGRKYSPKGMDVLILWNETKIRKPTQRKKTKKNSQKESSNKAKWTF